MYDLILAMILSGVLISAKFVKANKVSYRSQILMILIVIGLLSSLFQIYRLVSSFISKDEKHEIGELFLMVFGFNS